MSDLPDDITSRLGELAAEATPQAWGDLLPLVYDQLRRMAAGRLRRERRDHTLVPTALVHEAYMRLVDQSRASYQDRGHFYAIAARAMRQILIESARRRKAEKRGGGRAHHSLAAMDLDVRATDADPIELLALDEALNELAGADPRAARVVELRIFAGLSIEETSEVLGVGHATVERDWRAAQAWLLARLGDGDGSQPGS
ncbi:MAG: sigma-70 family RNA polymerase sigma factor [Phycisphaerales bacterium]|nr:sigma-70 family RNA polymerase sigma factor [Phycisphaerales bacterium]